MLCWFCLWSFLWHGLSKTHFLDFISCFSKVSIKNILQNWYYNDKDQCCGIIEIICPCSKEELARLVHFLYHGEIQCDDVYDYFKSQEDLSKIFDFPEDFNIECQIATLLDDPTLSSIIDTALYEEIVNSVDDEIIMQSSDVDFVNQDMRNPKVGDEICSNFASNTGSILEVDDILVQITTAIDSKRNPLIHGSMIDKTEVEIDLNNNLVNETYIKHGVDENLEG